MLNMHFDTDIEVTNSHCIIMQDVFFRFQVFTMTDIYETEFAYETACKERSISANPMIRDVLALDRDENLLSVSISVVLVKCCIHRASLEVFNIKSILVVLFFVSPNFSVRKSDNA
jgi:hypothetical protein